MMDDFSVSVLNRQGESVETVNLSSQVFGTHVRPELIHRAVVRYGRNQRVGTAAAKSRGQVNRSNKKPWSQKGTGRARSGTRRSPVWVGGGVTFGPQPRSYSCGMNRKQRRLAMKSAVLSKFADGTVVVVDKIELEEPKTKLMAALLEKLDVTKSCLIGMKEVPEAVLRATRNLPGVKIIPVREFNAYNIVRKKKILLTRDALDALIAEPTTRSEDAKEAE